MGGGLKGEIYLHPMGGGVTEIFFNSEFKVLRKLPYEAIIGRGDMIKNNLSLPRWNPAEYVSWERRFGQPVLQTQESVQGAHMDKIADPLYVRAQHDTFDKGSVPLARGRCTVETGDPLTEAPVSKVKFTGVPPPLPFRQTS